MYCTHSLVGLDEPKENDGNSSNLFLVLHDPFDGGLHNTILSCLGI